MTRKCQITISHNEEQIDLIASVCPGKENRYLLIEHFDTAVEATVISWLEYRWLLWTYKFFGWKVKL